MTKFFDKKTKTGFENASKLSFIRFVITMTISILKRALSNSVSKYFDSFVLVLGAIPGHLGCKWPASLSPW